MKTKLLLIVISISLFSSCSKETSFDFDYFAFGTAYGECLGNCAKFFQIKDNKLYADDMDYYFNSDLKFLNEPLPAEKYNQAKKLIEDFPDYLKNNPNKTFGCPDCADQGGIHIEIKNNDRIEYWHIDTDLNNQPTEIKDYIQEMLLILEQLQ
jgi:uncharacterized protein YlaI